MPNRLLFAGSLFAGAVVAGLAVEPLLRLLGALAHAHGHGP
jgi:hypothetical protein